MGLGKRIEEIATRAPDKVAFLAEDQQVTFSEFDDRASRIAGGLRELGVEPGDRVALMAGSHPEFVASVIATCTCAPASRRRRTSSGISYSPRMPMIGLYGLP